MRQWARRASAVKAELADVADVSRLRWWLLAGTAAVDWNARGGYVNSDAEPASDTFIGHASEPPVDPIADAIARAHAARQAILELAAELPDQPLATSVARTTTGARMIENALTSAEFVTGTLWHYAVLKPRIEDEHALAAALAEDIAIHARNAASNDGRVDMRRGKAFDPAHRPFVCVTLGEEPGATARHAHRRAWHKDGGPWLGLSRADGMAITSTCHLAVDGYGHARLAARIAELTRELVGRAPRTANGPHVLPPPCPVAGAVPLTYAWRSIPPGLRSLPLAYALGTALHDAANDRAARFSPTIQIPVSPGAHDEPNRLRKRALPAITSVRFERGVPEPFDVFAARTKQILAREAAGDGVMSRMHRALRAIPTPLVWKRRAMAAERPGWLDTFGVVIGGRGCVSRIELDVTSPLACAVSSPSRMASATDPVGACVVTIIDDGDHAAITLCGSGAIAERALLETLLEQAMRYGT